MPITVEDGLLSQNDSTQASKVLYEQNTGIAIDYSPYLARIANALETIASNTPTLASNSSVIASGIDTLKTLAEGDGIRMVTPYEWIGLVSSYRLYVEDSGAIGLSKLQEYKDKINTLPKGF